MAGSKNGCWEERTMPTRHPSSIILTMNSAAYLTTLHRLLNEYFSLEEIHTLCFNLHIDYESVPGKEKQSRIRELLLGLGRCNRLSDLIPLLQQERPLVDWPLVPDNFQLPEALAEETAVPTNPYHVYGDIVQGDKIDGDKITIGDVSDGSVVAAGAGAVAVGSRGVYVPGNVYGNINTGDTFYSDIQKSLATYIKNKRDEWKKEETTAWHIRLSGQICPYSLKEEIKQKNVAVWTSTSNVEQAVAEFNGCCVILGEPGSGKSTLLRKMAYEAALRYKDNSTEYLPVFLDLHRWPAETEFAVYLAEHLYQETQYRKPLPYGEMTLFLDGLNEMTGDLEEKVKEINEFLNRLNVDPASKDGLRVIASCRNRAYTEKISLELPRIIINPLAEEQVRDYLRKREGEDLAPYLFDETDSDSQLATLVERPFFLDMLVGLYQDKAFDLDALIHLNRGLIIRRYVEYFWQRERNSRIRPYATYVPELEVIQQVLEQLALDMQTKNDGAAISAQIALQTFLEKLGTLPKSPRLKKIFKSKAETQREAEFLLRVSEASSILKISSDGTFVEFQHDLFREYFAACYLHRSWRQNRLARRSNKYLYQYLGQTILSHDEMSRKQQPWDEVWFTFANLCHRDDLDTFIQEASDEEPFFAAEIASRTRPGEKCLKSLTNKLVEYATYPNRCNDRWINCQKIAVYALKNFSHTDAIIQLLVGLMDDRKFKSVSWPLLWQIGEEIGIPSLLGHMNAYSQDGTIWGLFVHGDPSGESLFNYEFFKLGWLFDSEMYDAHLRDWVRTYHVKEAYVADIQAVITLIEKATPVASTILPYISDRALLDACLRILPTTQAVEKILSIILVHRTLTSEDILHLLQHEHAEIPEATALYILNSQNRYHSRTPVRRELFNQPDIAFCLVKLWYTASGVGQEWVSQDSKRKYYRQLLKILEPASVLPALSEFVQQTDLSTEETQEIFNLLEEHGSKKAARALGKLQVPEADSPGDISVDLAEISSLSDQLVAPPLELDDQRAVEEVRKTIDIDEFFSSLFDSFVRSHDSFHWLLSNVHEEIWTIAQETPPEDLIRAWMDIPSPALQEFIADRYLTDIPKTVPFVVKYAVSSPKREIRFYALRILESFDVGQAINGIHSLCSDQNTDIRQLAVGMLAQKRDIRAIDSLTELIKDPPQITDGDWDRFLLWDEWNRGVRGWNRFMWWIQPLQEGFLLNYAGDYADDIADLLNDEPFRKAATNLLIKIDNPKTEEVLESLAKSSNPAVSSWGNYGLDKIREKKKQAPYSIPPLSSISGARVD